MSNILSFSSLILCPFDAVTATERECCMLNDFLNRMRAEQLPDDPPIPLDEAIQGWRNTPDFIKVWRWLLWDEAAKKVVASVWVGMPYHENQHLAWFGIDVEPERRRQGLARRLLSLVVERAQIETRRLLMPVTTERVPAGARFLERMGAQPGSVGHISQLALAHIDHALLQQWLAQAMTLNVDFELGIWIGEYPDEHLSAIVELANVSYNSMPNDQLDVKERKFTIETQREVERTMMARGLERWTIYLLERASSCLVGYTEVIWNPNRSSILEQQMTGVFPVWRNRGLGHWLKAAMLEKVLRDRPQVRFIRTANADSNAAMLKINRALGFNPYLADTVWQIETKKAAAYLER